MTPQRVQRKRTKGWRMPPNTVSVTRPGRWGNPWKVGQVRGYIGDVPQIATAEDCVELFRCYAMDPDEPMDVSPLRGKNLACWCAIGQPCHGDVLLEIANR